MYVGFSLNWPVNKLCGIVLNSFIDRRYIDSWLVFSTQLVNCCPHGRRKYTCILLPLYLLSDLPPLRPSQTKCTVPVYTENVWSWGGGGGALNCAVDHILQEFYTLFLTRFRTYKIASPPQTKTSKDDIKGLEYLKFLRPWVQHMRPFGLSLAWYTVLCTAFCTCHSSLPSPCCTFRPVSWQFLRIPSKHFFSSLSNPGSVSVSNEYGNTAFINKCSVADPDPHSFWFVSWIRIRIANKYPDPGGPKWPTNMKKIPVLKC